MKGQELENFRKALLEVADANGTRYGIGVTAFKLHVSNFGFENATAEQIQRELDYLREKQLLDEVPKSLSPENRLWRINAQGRDFLAQRAV